MLGVDTRAMSKAEMGYEAVDASGSHQKDYSCVNSVLVPRPSYVLYSFHAKSRYVPTTLDS